MIQILPCQWRIYHHSINFLNLLLSCFLVLSLTSCNKSKSCFTERDASSGTFSALYGGYLEQSRWVSPIDKVKNPNSSTKLHVVRSTAHFVPSQPRDPKSASFVAWTADNIMRFDSLNSLNAEIYIDSGFSPFSLKSHVNEKMVNSINQIKLWKLPDSSTLQLSKMIIDGLYPQPLSLILKQYTDFESFSCTFLDENNNSYCIDLLKLKPYNFQINDLDLKKEIYRKLLLKKLDLMDVEEEIVNSIPKEFQLFIKSLPEKLALMEEKSALISLFGLIKKINLCQGSTDSWCSEAILSKFKTLLIDDIFPDKRNLFNEYQNGDENKLKKEIYDSYMVLLNNQSQFFDWIIKNKKENWLTVHTHLNKNQIKYFAFPAQALKSKDWEMTPFKKRNKFTFFKLVKLRSNVSLFNSASDNGAIMTFRGLFPLGVISTIATQESGGAVLRPLPRPSGDISDRGVSLDASSEKGPSSGSGC